MAAKVTKDLKDLSEARNEIVSNYYKQELEYTNQLIMLKERLQLPKNKALLFK